MNDGILEHVKDMVVEQEELWEPNLLRCNQSMADWLVIIMEELGKASQATVRFEMNDVVMEWQRIRHFLVSAAGVIVSAIEAMDGADINCVFCCHSEESPEDRECPENCPVLLAQKLLAEKEAELVAR